MNRVGRALHRAAAWLRPPPSRPAALPAESPRGAFARPLLPGAPFETRLDGRAQHRHLWFSAACRAGQGESALEELDRWLQEEPPEEAWSHPSDAAVRLVHWWLGLSWLEIEPRPDLWRRLSGAVASHAHFTLHRPMLDPPDFRVLAQASGLVVAGLGWPGLPGASTWWSEGIAWLGRHLDAAVGPDGAPTDRNPRLLLRSLHLMLCARAACRVAGVGFPTVADGAIARAAGYLRAFGEGFEGLPPFGRTLYEPVIPHGELTPWNTASALGILPDLGGPLPDPDAALLAGRLPETGPPLAAAKEWSLRSFRDGGYAVAHARVKGGGSRLAVDAADARVIWDLADRPLLDGAVEGDWPAGRLEVARTDDRKTTIIVDRGAWRRELRLEGTRLQVVDRFATPGERRVSWRLAGWAPGATEKGLLQLDNGGIRAEASLDESAQWVVQDGQLLARSHADRVRFSVEIR